LVEPVEITEALIFYIVENVAMFGQGLGQEHRDKCRDVWWVGGCEWIQNITTFVAMFGRAAKDPAPCFSSIVVSRSKIWNVWCRAFQGKHIEVERDRETWQPFRNVPTAALSLHKQHQ
jgi:hypothetical protein